MLQIEGRNGTTPNPFLCKVMGAAGRRAPALSYNGI